VVLALLLVWHERDDIALLSGTSAWLAAGMVFMHIVSLGTQSERFRLILISHSGKPLSVVKWMRTYVRGRLFSSLVPQSGHVYRALDLKRRVSTPMRHYASSAIAQKWMAAVANFGFAAAFSWAAWGISSQSHSAAMPLVLLAFERLRKTRIALLAEQILGLVRQTVRSSGVVAAFLIYSLVGFITGAFALRLAFSIAGEEVAWVTAASILSFLYLGGLVTLTPANLGLQELGLGGLVTVFGLPPSIGVVVSLVVRLSNVVSVALLASLLEVDWVFATRRGERLEVETL
jgi:hypothetical protein